MWGSGVGWGGAGIARADALLRPDWPRAASGVLPWLPLSTSGQRLVGRTRVCREEGPVAESRCGSWHASQGGRKAPAGKGLSRAGVVAGRRRFSPVTAPVVASPPRAVTSTPRMASLQCLVPRQMAAHTRDRCSAAPLWLCHPQLLL